MKKIILMGSGLFAILSSVAFFQNWQSIPLSLPLIFLIVALSGLMGYYLIDYVIKKEEKTKKENFATRGNREDRGVDTSLYLSSVSDKLNYQDRMIIDQPHQFLALLDNIDVGICLLDKAQKILASNSQMAFVFNDSHPFHKAFSDINQFFTIEEIVRECYRLGERQDRIVALLTPDEKTVQVVVVPIKPDEKTVTQVLLIIRDISEMKLLEKAKTDLVTNASHELKTPLTIIKGFVETIQLSDKTDIATLDYFLDIIYKECQRLELLIQDITLLSACDRQSVSLQMTSVNLQTVYNRVLEASKLMLHKRQLTLVIPESTTTIWIDENRLVQVLLELVANAMTYTENSGDIRIIETISEKGVKIDIKDTGIGISKRDLDQIFDRFYRGQNAQTKNEHGTGLGLSIVKNLVRTMQGTVSIKSSLGKGTTVTLRFPFLKQ